MTPAARIQAAIEVLDSILAGEPAEKALTNWARASRFAGAKDRAAVRDHVFDALRCRRSFAWLGGAETGRGLMIGALRASGTDPNTLFSGEKYAPPPLSADERPARDLSDAPRAVRLDCPDWLLPLMAQSLGPETDATLALLRRRAPVFLRVNLRRTGRDQAAEALAAEGIETRPHPLSPSALEVTANARRVRASRAFREGLVELQDAASQAVVDMLPLRDGMAVLDYCAGGGGKTLAMGARADLNLVAHDAAPGRMRDLPARAARAGLRVDIAEAGALTGRQFDLVLCDVPCSGSGAWRRMPEGKWRQSAGRLEELRAQQAAILQEAAELVRPKGALAYVTCSLLRAENEAQIDAFLARKPSFRLEKARGFTPAEGGDGFFVALLSRE